MRHLVLKEETEEGRRKDSPMRDAGAIDALGCCRGEISTGGSADADIAEKPTDQIRVDGTVAEF